MTILVIAEHNNVELNAATLNTVAAAQAIGGDIEVLVAGAGCGAVAEERTKVFKEQEAAFFDTIKNKAGIQHLEDGLYYEVIEEGAGVKPSSEDEVTVHYKGSLANGKVFDDSYQRGAPLDIDLGNV